MRAPRAVTLKSGADFAGFRRALRALVLEGISPEGVAFSDAANLFGEEPAAAPPDAPALRLPPEVVETIEGVIPHRDPARYGLLYALVWRVITGERDLLEVASDPVVHRLDLMRRGVRRDLHKMHAFLRFRQVEGSMPERFVAWFEPEHHILEAAAPFFVDRFGSLHWSILTPEGSAHWDRERLTFGPPGRREDAPASDGFEQGWTDYYSSIFNPARTNPKAMRAEMPKKYWRNMPEAAAIPHLIRTAPQRVTRMIEQEATMPQKRKPEAALAGMFDQEPKTLDELNRIIREAEPLVPGATQAVTGEGPIGARIAFVGEQPGDQEDRQGRPFVGPAGQLLTRALREAGIAREEAYLTNAVKHFKFDLKGTRRIHAKPTAGEVKHYRWWLQKELELVRPRLVVALGATAVLALTGKALPITRARGRAAFETRDGRPLDGFITVHPSYLLRLPDEETKARAYAEFVADLVRARDIGLSDPETGELPLAAE
jgi:DNA polymerase